MPNGSSKVAPARRARARCGRELRFWAPRVAVGLIFGAVMLSPVMLRAGWPYNHDGLRPLLRIAETWGQWHAGHLLPIWSNASQEGLGSPGVLLYHKLFAATGALIRFVAPGPKRELIGTLLVMMVVNVLGVGVAIRAAAGRPHFAIESLCGIVAISCNYAFTDWLTRGAVAEFSAYCVLPYLFAWSFAWLRTGRPSLWIGPLMWLLWMAHSAIATFVWVLLGPCVVLAAVAHGRQVLRAVPRLAMAVAIFVAMSLPWALAAVPMIAWAQVTNMIRVWRPETTHEPFVHIFHDTQWDWTGPWWRFTPQLDPVLIATLAALVPVVAFSRPQRPAASLCLATAACALALQLHAALPVYRLIPGFEYIAFTWRLLTYLSMSLAIGLGVVLLALEQARPQRRAIVPALVCVALVAALVDKPRRPAPQTPWFAPGELALGQRGIPSNLLSVEYPEYLPRTPSGPGHPRDHWQAAVAAHLCQARPLEDPMLEAARSHFRNVCPIGQPTVLPDFLAPGMRLTADGATIAIWRTCDDPRVRFVVPTATIVVLHMPTLARALHDWWVVGPAYPKCSG